MSMVISIHSFRGGTGKSSTAADVATLLAAEGQRIGVIDTDLRSPRFMRPEVEADKDGACSLFSIGGVGWVAPSRRARDPL